MKVLIAVTHLLGAGHLTRAATLARVFAGAGHEVVLVSGGRPAPLVRLDRIRLVQLPPVHIEGVAFDRLLSADDTPAGPDLFQARRALLLDTLASFGPDVVLTELFPFGRRGLAAEFLALVETARARPQRPLILASVRDILVAPDRKAKVDEAHERVAALYDAVLVHGDPALAPLEASWPVDERLADKLHYTGYVDEGGAPPEPGARAGILVAAGSSAAGIGLFHAAVAAARAHPELGWRILVGHGVTDLDLARLRLDLPAGTVTRARPEYRDLLAGAAVSVSQCGYNTAVDLLVTGTPAVLVPFEAGRETEQRLRAERLAALGLARILPESEVSAESLVVAVRGVLAGKYSDDGHSPPQRDGTSEPNELADSSVEPTSDDEVATTSSPNPEIPTDDSAGHPSPRLRGEAHGHLVVSVGSEGEAEAEVRGLDEGGSFGDPPHLRLPPRFGDDEVAEALSPQAGRGELEASRLASHDGQDDNEPTSPPSPLTPRLDGSARTVAIVEALRRKQRASPVRQTTDLIPLRAALDRAAENGRTVELWWRDDDAVSATPALDRLLALADGAPLLIAAIPAGAEPSLARRLATAASVSVAVHGLAHADHAPPGEKAAEFGAHRPLSVLHREATEALRRARERLPAEKLLKVFVPPWNRIAPDLARDLPLLGYTGLSAAGGPPVPGLTRADCTLDVIDWRGTRSLRDPARLLATLSAHAEAEEERPLGLTTHHLAHDEAVWEFLAKLIPVLKAHPAVRLRDPRDLFGPAVDAGARTPISVETDRPRAV